jgi:lipid-A-disaccharide synthase
MAAPVVERLGTPSFGLGGSALAAAGMNLVVDLADVTAMGVGAVLTRSPFITRAAMAIVREVRARRPTTALLVGYSEFNAWLGPWLRRRGTRVLWYGAPQIWAWRPGRARAIAAACDRMAVILPFEEQLWRSHGVDAYYVGHPVLEPTLPPRAEVRKRYGLTPYADYLALLPGSRPHEVEQHLEPMTRAVGLMRAEHGSVDARVILAPSLNEKTRRRACKLAADLNVGVLEVTAQAVLPAFDVAIACSGTVTLECAVASVPPVIVYKTGPITHRVGRYLLRTPHIALPNIILGELAFPELLQEQVTAPIITQRCTHLLDHKREYLERCVAVQKALRSHWSPARREAAADADPLPSEKRPSEQVAELLSPWLAA